MGWLVESRKCFVLRFDVDTRPCLHSGVPALLELAKNYDIPMTFFVNMGRAISRKIILKRAFETAGTKENAPKLSAIEKFGYWGVLQALLLNPSVGKGAKKILARSYIEGHEIGLHGGRNHADWQNYACDWSSEKLNDEVRWGVKRIRDLIGYNVQSFSSPGWCSSELLPQVISAYGMKVIADDHDPDLGAVILNESASDIKKLNTNLAGEPGGVGYLEYCEARGLSNEEMCREVDAKIEEHDSLVMYDHPAYAGRKGVERLRCLVEHLKNKEVVFYTVSGFSGIAG